MKPAIENFFIGFGKLLIAVICIGVTLYAITWTASVNSKAEKARKDELEAKGFKEGIAFMQRVAVQAGFGEFTVDNPTNAPSFSWVYPKVPEKPEPILCIECEKEAYRG